MKKVFKVVGPQHFGRVPVADGRTIVVTNQGLPGKVHIQVDNRTNVPLGATDWRQRIHDHRVIEQ